MNSWKNARIAVLMGGLSSEREVSLQSGAGVHQALVDRGYDAVAVDWTEGSSPAALLAGFDVVWNALHGTYGEDGAVQGLCACLGIACTGSGILASALAMDKVTSKRIFDSSKVPTPGWAEIESVDQLEPWTLPLVVKPALEGSSVGVSIVTERDQLAGAFELAARHGPVIVEHYIDGAEVCTGILDGEVLGSVQVVPATGFYDYDAKYVRDDTQYLLPPPIDADILAVAEEIALRAHRALGCGGYSRVDMMISERGAPFVLEVNTLPGMTGHSLMPKIAAYRGIDYGTLCERILAGATNPHTGGNRASQ